MCILARCFFPVVECVTDTKEKNDPSHWWEINWLGIAGWYLCTIRHTVCTKFSICPMNKIRIIYSYLSILDLWKRMEISQFLNISSLEKIFILIERPKIDWEIFRNLLRNGYLSLIETSLNWSWYVGLSITNSISSLLFTVE